MYIYIHTEYVYTHIHIHTWDDHLTRTEWASADRSCNSFFLLSFMFFFSSFLNFFNTTASLWNIDATYNNKIKKNERNKTVTRIVVWKTYISFFHDGRCISSNSNLLLRRTIIKIVSKKGVEDRIDFAWASIDPQFLFWCYIESHKLLRYEFGRGFLSHADD